MSRFAFLEPGSSYHLPKSFDFNGYIEIEREMWAFFPETCGRRVNFCQLGLTAQVFVESDGTGDLGAGETYFLMPCPDRMLRPIRMKPLRRLTLEEFRMSHLTAIRMAEKLALASRLMQQIHMRILGPEIVDAC